MKKLLKPASLLFNLLSLLVFFIIGMYFAGWMEAGKNQGLAGGAIVFGWGVLFGGIAFVASFFATYRLPHGKIKTGNWVLFVILLLGYGITHYRFMQRDKLQKERNKPYNKETPTKPAPTSEPTAMLFVEEEFKEVLSPTHLKQETQWEGMGYFAPNFNELSVLYFYGNPNLKKPEIDISPYDSLTFKRNTYNQFEIATAPPWLVPDIMKLDYDTLYFKIESVTEEFVEVIVNSQNNRTAYVRKSDGNVVYWPDFLLGVHSVEFLPGSNEKVRARPFQASGSIHTEYQFMKPIKIKGDWAEVWLLDAQFQNIGKGWIPWRRDNKLLVRFNLFS
ncbi:hypothetical protein [uncultured Kriegella sp.]|uniref:hypothetical protein n=1 Tax=uncultured Kriegella sp. TaxID=1798910 RepID=UPI0030D88F9B|tara:strand:- start:3800 stop:4798 length:999 start_codon:yes stop_codon:yes gene_type:complete